MGVVSSWALIQWKPAAVDLSCITWRTLIIQDCFVSTVVPVFVCCWVSHLFFSSPSLITEHLSERALLSPAVFRVLALQSFFHNKDLVGVWVYLLVFVAKFVYFPSYPAVVFHLYMWLSPPSLPPFFPFSINWRNCHQVKIKSRLMDFFYFYLDHVHLNSLTCKAVWIFTPELFSQTVLAVEHFPDVSIMNRLNSYRLKMKCLHCVSRITTPPDWSGLSWRRRIHFKFYFI